MPTRDVGVCIKTNPTGGDDDERGDLHRNGSDPRRSRRLRTDVTEGPRNNLTERRAGQVKRETRYDYAAAVGARYQRSSREQKGWILDEFCAATGYNRKYAIKLLHGPHPRVALPVGHGRPPLYGQAEAAVLRTCWEIADHVCSKRLAPFLPELLDRLRACGELSDLSPALVDRVANMSAATIDRLLVPYRAAVRW